MEVRVFLSINLKHNYGAETWRIRFYLLGALHWRPSLSLLLCVSPEHAGHRHAAGEEADAALQQRQGGRDAGVLRAGERRRRAQQTHGQATAAAGQGAGLPPVRVLPGGEEPPGLRVSHTSQSIKSSISSWKCLFQEHPGQESSIDDVQ